MKDYGLLRLALLFLLAATAHPWTSTHAAPAQSLFDDHEPLELTLQADWRSITKARGNTDRIWQAELRYWDEEGVERSIPLGISTRGLSRLDRRICRFPGLFLHFEGGTDSGLFDAQHALPLVSHCKKSRQYEQYVVQEYLLYRVYNLVTDWSLRVRLVNVTYEPTDRGRSFTGIGFMVENYHSMADRIGGEIVEITPFHPNDADPMEMSLLEVYQYFIGNTDWSVVYQHNIALLKRQDGTIAALPYDFDGAGAVNAAYARPDERLPIDTVRERLFRGICRPREFVDAALKRFRDRHADIEALYRSQPLLEERELEKSLQYYGEFYETVSGAKSTRRAILSKCRKIRVKRASGP